MTNNNKEVGDVFSDNSPEVSNQSIDTQRDNSISKFELTPNQVNALVGIVDRFMQGNLTGDDWAMLRGFSKYDKFQNIRNMLEVAFISAGRSKELEDKEKIDALLRIAGMQTKIIDSENRQKVGEAHERSINVRTINSMLSANREKLAKRSGLGGVKIIDVEDRNDK